MNTEENITAIQEGDAGPPEHRIPPVAEALGYAGGALALAALVTIVLMFRQVTRRLGARRASRLIVAIAASSAATSSSGSTSRQRSV